MAGTVQRLIRHVWGFLVSPASIENKQQSFNEGDNGSGRDRTQLVAKGPTGTLHTWITVDEIEDYVKSEISSSSSSVYVKVTNLNELTNALASTLTPNMTIFCDSDGNNGLVLTGDTFEGIIVNGKKVLVGSGNRSITIDSSGATTALVFDVQSGSELEIFDKLQLRQHGQIINIGNEGVGHLRISEIEGNDSTDPLTDTLNVFNGTGGGGDPEKCILENNNTPLVISQESTIMSFSLWSGKYTSIKKLDTEKTSEVIKNTVLSSYDANISAPEVLETVEDGGTDNVIYRKKYNRDNGDIFAKESIFSQNKIANQDSVYEIELFQGNFSTILRALSLSYNYLNVTPSIGVTWDTFDYSVIQSGGIALFSKYIIGQEESGVAYDCYYDGNNWFFLANDVKPRIEVYKDGVLQVYSTPDTPNTNNPFTPVPVPTKAVYNAELSSFPIQLGEISGLTLPVSVAGKYLISFKCIVFLDEINSVQPYITIRTYVGASSVDEVNASLDIDQTYAGVRTTLCTSFVYDLSGSDNVTFDIDLFNGQLLAQNAKVSAVQL